MDRNWETAPEVGVAKVDVPCLMVTAAWDWALRPELAAGMPALIPDLEMQLIERCGHWTQQEKPAELNRILVDWLARRFRCRGELAPRLHLPRRLPRRLRRGLGGLAAWGEDALYVARGHDDTLRPADYAGDHVLFARHRAPAHAWKGLAEQTERLVVLDHHVSARDRYLADPSLAGRVADNGHHVVFDLAHSGAVLAWQHLHPDRPLPELLAYVEDQDLWRLRCPPAAR